MWATIFDIQSFLVAYSFKTLAHEKEIKVLKLASYKTDISSLAR